MIIIFKNIYYYLKGLLSQTKWIIIHKWNLILDKSTYKPNLKIFKVQDSLYIKSLIYKIIYN